MYGGACAQRTRTGLSVVPCQFCFASLSSRSAHHPYYTKDESAGSKCRSGRRVSTLAAAADQKGVCFGFGELRQGVSTVLLKPRLSEDLGKGIHNTDTSTNCARGSELG